MEALCRLAPSRATLTRRHPELGSGSISPLKPERSHSLSLTKRRCNISVRRSGQTARWILKQVQDDGVFGVVVLGDGGRGRD